jgi:hypothetical protein
MPEMYLIFTTDLIKYLEFYYKNVYYFACILYSRFVHYQLYKFFIIRIYKTIILLFVLYGYETWCLILREEHRVRVFENRALRRIFGPKRDEVTGGSRKLHNEELHIACGLRQ